MAKVKTCKKCDKKKYANLNLCYAHYREREKVKREEKALKKLERKKGTKKYKESEKKTWRRKTWKLMSEWIRRKDADFAGYVNCYTCNKVMMWNEGHCSHFFHGKLDFDERNLKNCCPYCNTYLSGNLGLYSLRLIKENSIEWLEELKAYASLHTGYSLEELKEIHADLTEKLKGI